jgi:gas vesicle protein
MSDNDDFGTFFAGFIIGGMVGAAVALLLAPQSGEETRTIIKEKGIVLRDKAVEYGQDARANAEKAVSQARIRVDDAMADLRARTSDLERITKDWVAQFQSRVATTGPETPTPEESA